MFFNQTRLSERWSMHAEAQYRSYEIAPNTEQLLLRCGVNYHISASFGAQYTHTLERRDWQVALFKCVLQRGLQHCPAARVHSVCSHANGRDKARQRLAGQ